MMEEVGGGGRILLGLIFIILTGFGGSFLDKGAIHGVHFNIIHENSFF